MTRYTTRLLGVLVALCVLTTAVAAPAGAQQARPDADTSAYEAFEVAAERYNEDPMDVFIPVLPDILREETVNVYVRDDAGRVTERFAFRVGKNFTIDWVVPRHVEDASARIEADRVTIDSIVESESPATKFRWHLKEGDIDVRGERGSITDQVAWTMVKLSEPAVRFMYDLFTRHGLW